MKTIGGLIALLFAILMAYLATNKAAQEHATWIQVGFLAVLAIVALGVGATVLIGVARRR